MRIRPWWVICAALLLTALVYAPGLSGSWLFDDYPNIVDNHGVQPGEATVASLVRAALSSPSSEFKRPLASLSFAANYLAAGLNPYSWKVTNLLIHLLNGWLVFLLARALLRSDLVGAHPVRDSSPPPPGDDWLSVESHSRTGCAPTDGHVDIVATLLLPGDSIKSIAAEAAPTKSRRVGIVAALIAACWMLLPINLTGVLYVVQRMESMANLFVLTGLIGYVAGRRRMLGMTIGAGVSVPQPARLPGGFLLCLLSITVPTALGILAKETAVMLPLYAVLIEWLVFGFRRAAIADVPLPAARRDRRIIALFVLVLALPMVVGLSWLLPGLFNPEAWATRDFSMTTRLLSEARIIVDYLVWTVLPTPGALSFYHDDFHVSSGLLSPWTTLASIVFLAALIALMLWLRRRQPLAALGIALFLSCQLLTGTILPLELIYEHRNYFASFGLMLAIVPLLAAPCWSGFSRDSSPSNRIKSIAAEAAPTKGDALLERLQSRMLSRTPTKSIAAEAAPTRAAVPALPMALLRYILLATSMLYWTGLTAVTAYAWGNPQRLAESLAARAPQSPRAQYELGRNYIINSHYDPASPYTRMAYAPLERAAKLPDSSILPQQALIFMNSRMHLPLKDAWWDSMIAKLKAHKPGVQDESSLAALTKCNREGQCDLPRERMVAAFQAALAHPDPNARLYATYSDYAWSVLDNHDLGLRMIQRAVKGAPSEPAYQITLIRMLSAQGRTSEAQRALKKLTALNIGGRLNHDLSALRALPGMH